MNGWSFLAKFDGELCSTTSIQRHQHGEENVVNAWLRGARRVNAAYC